MNEKPNLLLIMVDQLRHDHVGWSPHARLETPNIDRIAEGVAFDRAYSVNPVCMPARSALLTGKYSRQVGCLSMSGDLPLEHPTFTRALQGAGYHTSMIGKLHVNQPWPWQVDRHGGTDLIAHEDQIKQYGFDHVYEVSGKQLAVKNRCHFTDALERAGLLEDYCDYVDAEGPNTTEVSSTEFTGKCWPYDESLFPDHLIKEAGIEQLARMKGEDQPFFMHLSFCSPHPPFDPPERFLREEEAWLPLPVDPELSEEKQEQVQRMARSYRAMIRMLDAYIGEVFDALKSNGQWDNTVIAFVSDHGEMLGDLGRMQKNQCYDGSARIPFAIRHPEYLQGRVDTSLVELTDLTATLLDCAGLSAKEALAKSWAVSPWPGHAFEVPCRSLLPRIQSESLKHRDFAYSENIFWQMLVGERYKYVRFRPTGEDAPGEELLFDLESDPQELENLSGADEFQALLHKFRNALLGYTERYMAAQTSWMSYRAQKTSR